LEVQPSSGSLLGRFFDPVGSVYDNFVRVQDQDYDLMVQQASGWMPVPLEVVDLQLRHGDEEQISLSWHLTAVERKRVMRSLGSAENRASLARIRALLVDGSSTVNDHDGPRVLAKGPAPQPATSSPGPASTRPASP
jgi:hypothetical protein